MKSILYISVLLLVLFSCTNSATDDAATRNSIAAEAQLQQMNRMLYDSGERHASNIWEELITTPKNEELVSKRHKLTLMLNRITEIDSITKKIIYAIDQIKFALLKTDGKNYPIWETSEVYPNPFDLTNLKNASDTEISSELLLNGDSPNKKGMDLFNRFKAYRNQFVQIVGRTEVQNMFVKDINDYKNLIDL